MSVIDTLIFDRTQNDVESRTKKGYYNSDDLNRVIGAVNYLAGVFQGYGYDIPGYSQQTDNWGIGKVPTRAQMQTYLSNIQSLNSLLAALPSTPALPQSMAFLDYVEANNIEQVLIDLDGTLQRLAQCAVACGPATCGGDYL